MRADGLTQQTWMLKVKCGGQTDGKGMGVRSSSIRAGKEEKELGFRIRIPEESEIRKAAQSYEMRGERRKDLEVASGPTTLTMCLGRGGTGNQAGNEKGGKRRRERTLGPFGRCPQKRGRPPGAGTKQIAGRGNTGRRKPPWGEGCGRSQSHPSTRRSGRQHGDEERKHHRQTSAKIRGTKERRGKGRTK